MSKREQRQIDMINVELNNMKAILVELDNRILKLEKAIKSARKKA